MSRTVFPGFFAGSLLFFCTIVRSATAQSCDDCDVPKIGLYETVAADPRPPGAYTDPQVKTWWKLLLPHRYALEALMNADPRRNCVRFVEGGIGSDDALRNGIEFAFLPPQGPIEGLDYLLYGVARTTGEVNEYELVLETAISRERVRSIKVTYSKDPAVLDNEEAGKRAAAAMGTLFDAIRDFERKKRDASPGIAMGGFRLVDCNAAIEITPDKRYLKEGETTEVTFILRDCDNKPLPGRTLIVSPTPIVMGKHLQGTFGGSFPTPTLTTDALGMVRAPFTAKEKGEGGIYVYYDHKTPVGRPNAFMEATFLTIDDAPPPEKWFVEATFTYHENITYDSTQTMTSIDGSTRTDVDHQYTFRNGHGYLQGQVMNESENGGFQAGYLYLPIREVYDAGESYFERASALSYLDGALWLGVRSNKQWTSKAGGEANPFEIKADFGPDWAFQLSVLTQIEGQSTSSTYEGTWDTYELPIEDYGILQFDCDPTSGDLVRSKEGYDLVCRKSEVAVDYMMKGEHRQYTSEVKASFRRLVDMEKTAGEAGPSPGTLRLHSNYPNPARDETYFSFELPSPSPVVFTLFDTMGRQVDRVEQPLVESGTQVIRYETGRLAPGLYLYVLRVGSEQRTGRLIVVH